VKKNNESHRNCSCSCLDSK